MALVKIAAVQLCSSAEVEANLATTAQWIAEAAKQQAKIIVLPEMFALMAHAAADKVALKEPLGEGKIQRFLAEQAKQHQLWIVGGTIPIACTDPHKIRAACLVYNDEGKVVARYDKIHMFDVVLSKNEIYRESDTTEPGNTPIVVDTPYGKLGIGVCYDIRFPELFRHLFNLGAEIIAIPAAFTVKTGEAHWELLTRSRAVENFCYVIGAAQGGAHSNGRQTYGHSLVVDPWGTIIAQKPDTLPGVLYATLDLQKLHEIRNAIPIAKHQKIFRK